MKKIYETPTFSVVELNVAPCICGSTLSGKGGADLNDQDNEHYLDDESAAW